MCHVIAGDQDCASENNAVITLDYFYFFYVVFMRGGQKPVNSRKSNEKNCIILKSLFINKAAHKTNKHV